MNSLVLGGAGFIGRPLIQGLLSRGDSVTSVSKSWHTGIPGARCVAGDVFDAGLLAEVLPGQDCVYHLVSATLPASSNQSPVFDCQSNILGTLNILEAMVRSDVKHIVFASSGGSVYGISETLPLSETDFCAPISAYGVSKLAIEKYLNLYSYLYRIKATVLRISNPFGMGQALHKKQGAISSFVQCILSDQEIAVWGDGSVIRDYIYIDDVIQAFLACERVQARYSVINIGAGQGYSLTEVINMIEACTGRSAAVEYKPSRNCDVPAVVLDISKAEKVLDWAPRYSVRQGIEKFIVSAKQERQLCRSG